MEACIPSTVFLCGRLFDPDCTLGELPKELIRDILTVLRYYYFSEPIYLAAATHTLLLTSKRTLCAWGYSDQAGLGSDNVPCFPLEIIQPPIKYKSLACGGEHSILLAEDGSVYACGFNPQGQLGLEIQQPTTIPTKVTLPGPAKYVSAGGYHSFALLENNALYGWGWNGDGQVGSRKVECHRTPTRIDLPPSMRVVSVLSGGNHSTLLTIDGGIYSWGKNCYGQLGLGDTETRDSPTRIETFTSGTLPSAAVVFIAIAGGTTFGITSDGALYGWGYNSCGQLASGDTENRLSPYRIHVGGENGSSDVVVSVSCGGAHTIVMMADRSLYAWGFSDNSELGLEMENALRPIPLILPEGVGRVTLGRCGYFHTIVITERQDEGEGNEEEGMRFYGKGQLWVCGLNDKGQLGLGHKQRLSGFQELSIYLSGDDL